MVNRLLWSMLTVKGCGMMWTLEYLEQDKVLYLRCDKALSSGKTRRYFSSKHELMEVLTLEEALDETSRNWADARTGKDQNSMCVVMELVQKVDFRVTLVTPPVKSAGPKPGPRRREDGFQQGTQLGIRVKPDSVCMCLFRDHVCVMQHMDVSVQESSLCFSLLIDHPLQVSTCLFKNYHSVRCNTGCRISLIPCDLLWECNRSSFILERGMEGGEISSSHVKLHTNSLNTVEIATDSSHSFHPASLYKHPCLIGMGRAGNSSSFLLPVVLSDLVGFNFLPDAGFCSLVVAVGNLGGGIKDVFLEVSAIVQPVLYGMSRSVYRKECLAECLASCAGREIRRAISTFNMKRSPSQVAWFSLSTQKFLPEEVRSWEDGDPLLWSMLTEKGCGMMWTLKHLKQDKVLFLEDECSIQAAVSVIEFNYRGKQVDIFSQNMDYGSLTLEEAFDETSRNLADARTG
ncbi:hypothetical protein KY289_030277 [Solanum tuberosum]|nr:hypothetical protein KY289_030277 [Solanum tuberosum]